MKQTFSAACIQLTSGPDIAANLAVASGLAREARARGADLICFPENVAMMEPDRTRIADRAMAEDDHHALAAFQALAQDTGAWLLVGSLTVRRPDGATANRSFLIDAQGEIVERCDKIHMFDVNLPNGEVYRESDTYAPGERAVLADTAWGSLGMSVCYDLRFPHLYRDLAKAGAKYLSVPSAFTRPTGEAHWHCLLRARAIETGCFVFAPAQCGTHDGGRATYGHSLIVDPWGRVLADGGEEPGMVLATIDPAQVDRARHMVPSLTHDRPYTLSQRP